MPAELDEVWGDGFGEQKKESHPAPAVSARVVAVAEPSPEPPPELVVAASLPDALREELVHRIALSFVVVMFVLTILMVHIQQLQARLTALEAAARR